MKACPPVVLVIFNRPDCTRIVLEVIRQARPTRLFVVADGPHLENANDAAACGAARGVVERGVDWPCEVQRRYADANMGCARRVSSGLDWVFSLVNEAIILEDDCVPDATFFPFCAEMLERYRDSPRIAQIAGCSFQKGAPTGGPSYYFSRYPHCWGWATWRRAWKHYDHEMQNWTTTRGRDWLEQIIDAPAERRYWGNSFDAAVSGRVDSWAYRWTMTVWKKNWLTVLPYQNLVSNIGFGMGATHTREEAPTWQRPLASLSFPLLHPECIERDETADNHTRRLLFESPTWHSRVRRRVKKLFCR